jgi:4a-hydroxytetrahydrobiopterin dehydratase
VHLVAEDADAMDHHPEVHLRLRTVTFTLTSNAERAVTQWDVELAHRILEAADAVGAEVLPAPPRVALTLRCADPDRVRPFWAAGLAYVERTARSGSVVLHDRSGRGPVLSFEPGDDEPGGPGPLRLDVHVPPDTARDRVEACLAAGGRTVDDAQAPLWWVLADPEGNELCVRTQAGATG